MRAVDLDNIAVELRRMVRCSAGIIAYNMQWDQLVLGGGSRLQASANIASVGERFDCRGSFNTSDEIQHDVRSTAGSSFKLVDYAALRGRAGYAIGPIPALCSGWYRGRKVQLPDQCNRDGRYDGSQSSRPPGGPRHISTVSGRWQRQRICGGRRRGPWHGLGAHAGMYSCAANGNSSLSRRSIGRRSNIQVGHIGAGMRF